MGTGTLTNRTDGQTITQTFFNSIHSALNEDLVPRNSSGVATDVAGDLGSTSFRWNDSYIVRMFVGAIASGISFEDDSGDLVLKRNSIEVGRFTVNGLDASDLVDASITLSKMAANSVDTSQIVAAAITLAKMDTNSVDTNQLVALAVETDKINSLAVTAAKLASNAVETAKILDANVSPSKLFSQSTGTYIRKSASVSTTPVTGATTTVASVSFTPATTTRVIRIGIIGSSTANSGLNFSSATTIAGNIIYRRAGTTIANKRITLSSTDLTLTGGSFDFDYFAPGTSGETYDVQFAASASTTMTATGLVFQVYHP